MPPQVPFLKINFDRAFNQNINRLGSGVIARNENGEILVSTSTLHFGVALPFMAEGLKCFIAVNLGLSLGSERVVIEGDSLSIIKKCRRNERDKSEIRAVITNIQLIKDQFKEIIFVHTPRSSNLLAHKVATGSLKESKEFYLVGGIPEYVGRERGR